MKQQIIKGDSEWMNQNVIFGKDTVYVHSDVHEVADPEGGVTYEGKEAQYSYAEWEAKQNSAIDELTIAILEG